MVPPYSLQIPRVCRYSGYSKLRRRFVYETLTLFGWPSHTIQLQILRFMSVRTPSLFLTKVWPLPISLATTLGISFDFFSSPYLDVSVREVPFLILFYSDKDLWLFAIGVSPFGDPRVKAYFQLTVAYRRLSRPSSALGAKAFTLCSFSLEQLLLLSFSQDLLLLLELRK